MEDLSAISAELGRAIDMTISAANSRNVSDLIAQLDSIERDFVARIAIAPDLVKETKRRVAEGKLMVAICGRVTLSVFSSLFDSLCQQGFGSFDRELTYRIIFARHCLDNGWLDRGLRVIEPLEERLLFEHGNAAKGGEVEPDIGIAIELLAELRVKKLDKDSE